MLYVPISSLSSHLVPEHHSRTVPATIEFGMKTLHNSTNIAAPKEIVWHVLFDDEMFRR